jgi:hypothetical protein
MLKDLGSLKRKTRDDTIFPFIFDGHFEWHGMPLYKFF